MYHTVSESRRNQFLIALDKAKRPRGEHRTLTCPFFECLKEFAETGNLKTHLRTHVSLI